MVINTTKFYPGNFYLEHSQNESLSDYDIHVLALDADTVFFNIPSPPVSMTVLFPMSFLKGSHILNAAVDEEVIVSHHNEGPTQRRDEVAHTHGDVVCSVVSTL